MVHQAFLKLNTTNVDSFCKNINTLNSDVTLYTFDSSLNAKSLLCLLSVDLSKEIRFVIYTEDEKELRRFREIIIRYGGTMD